MKNDITNVKSNRLGEILGIVKDHAISLTTHVSRITLNYVARTWGPNISIVGELEVEALVST